MNLMESFHPRIEGLPWSRSIPGLKDSSGVFPSLSRMTTIVGVIPFQDGRTPMESFYPRKE